MRDRVMGVQGERVSGRSVVTAARVLFIGRNSYV